MSFQPNEIMGNADSIYVVEYSASQNAFHVQTLLESIRANNRSFREQRPNDYQILLIGEEETVRNYCTGMQNIRNKREANNG